MKIKTQLQVDNTGNMTNSTITEGGVLQEMTCEHGECTCTIGKDYYRKNRFLKQLLGNEWAYEPIYLCDNHSKGYKPYGIQQ